MTDQHCPAAEELAAFIDRRLHANKREEVLEHLTRCEDCYSVFRETVRFQTGWRHRLPVLATLVGMASLLVLATGAISVLLVQGRRVSPLHLSLSELLDPLLEEGVVFSEDLWPSRSGRPGGLGLERASFRAGVRLVDLEISLRQNQRRRASRAAGELLEASQPPELDNLQTSRLAELLDEELDCLHVCLGKWTETGRLASRRRLHRVMEGDTFRRAARRFIDRGVSLETAASLERVDAALSDGQATPRELSGLENAFEQIMLTNW